MIARDERGAPGADEGLGSAHDLDRSFFRVGLVVKFNDRIEAIELSERWKADFSEIDGECFDG